MFSGKGDAFTVAEEYDYSVIDKYKTMTANNDDKNLITELTVEDTGLFHAISSGDHLDIIQENDGFIEVLNSREEVLKFIGQNNPSVRIYAEFEHITEFETEEEEASSPFGKTPDGFEKSSSVGFQGSPADSSTTKIESSRNTVHVYNEPLDEMEIEQKTIDQLSTYNQDLL